MTNVIFKITTALAALLGQVYEAENKVVLETVKMESSNPVTDTVHSKCKFAPVIANSKNKQAS